MGKEEKQYKWEKTREKLFWASLIIALINFATHNSGWFTYVPVAFVVVIVFGDLFIGRPRKELEKEKPRMLKLRGRK